VARSSRTGVIADPGFDESDSQSEWTHVLGFGGALLILAVALLLYGRMVGGRRAFQVSAIVGASLALAAVSNVVEDGLGKEAFFLVTAVLTAVTGLGLLTLTLVIARVGHGGYRWLAVIPLLTATAIVMYVWAGGPIMLAAWLGAAGLALLLPDDARGLTL
jgi:hypothetical protein